jgi:hypothetical protein
MERRAVMLVDEVISQLARPDVSNTLKTQIRALPHVAHDYPKHTELLNCRALIYIDAGEQPTSDDFDKIRFDDRHITSLVKQ